MILSCGLFVNRQKSLLVNLLFIFCSGIPIRGSSGQFLRCLWLKCSHRRVHPDRNEPISSVVVNCYPNAVQERACRGVPQIVRKIAHSPLLLRDTRAPIAPKPVSRAVEIKLSGEKLCGSRRGSHSLGCCVIRESERETPNADARLASRGGPGRCYCLEVLVLVICFP